MGEEGCTQKVTAYDSSERRWQHLNFFQYKTYIHARLPRIKCPEHGVKTASVAWARSGSGFTLLFESWCVECATTVIDTFHVIKHINEAVDKTRKAEATTNHELRCTKYLWLKNESSLSERQKSQKQRLMNNHLKTGRAVMMREALQDIYETAKDNKTHIVDNAFSD